MKLALYSGGLNNEHLDKRLIRSAKRDPQIAYIPYSSYETHSEFKEYVQQFKKLGVSRFLYCPIDIPIDDILRKQIFQSDIIHLGGGNTFYFINWLRKQKLMSDLRRFALAGGTLSGLSAGALIITLNIGLAGYPAFDCDENDEHIKNFSALKLAPFEIFPHFKNSKRYIDALKKYSIGVKHPIYGIPDGNGIFIDGNQMDLFGTNQIFFQGKCCKIAPK